MHCTLHPPTYWRYMEMRKCEWTLLWRILSTFADILFWPVPWINWLNSRCVAQKTRDWTEPNLAFYQLSHKLKSFYFTTRRQCFMRRMLLWPSQETETEPTATWIKSIIDDNGNLLKLHSHIRTRTTDPITSAESVSQFQRDSRAAL